MIRYSLSSCQLFVVAYHAPRWGLSEYAALPRLDAGEDGGAASVGGVYNKHCLHPDWPDVVQSFRGSLKRPPRIGLRRRQLEFQRNS